MVSGGRGAFPECQKPKIRVLFCHVMKELNLSIWVNLKGTFEPKPLPDDNFLFNLKTVGLIIQKML